MAKNNYEIDFQPASWLPSKDVEMLDRVRNIKREDMEYTNENGYSVRVVIDPAMILAQDILPLALSREYLPPSLSLTVPSC